MKREAEAPAAYEDVICFIGAHNKMVTNNAKVCTGIKWTTISRHFCIESGLSVPHHQHQNYAENCGGNFKRAVLRLLHLTPHAPLSYWCFAAEFLDKARGHWSKPPLSGASGLQMLRVKLKLLVNSASTGLNQFGTMMPLYPFLMTAWNLVSSLILRTTQVMASFFYSSSGNIR